MLPFGTAFIAEHLWFTISPNRDGRVLCVNLTTLHEKCADDECILHPCHYAWIKHPSAVAFSRARAWDAAKVRSALDARTVLMPKEGPVPNATVNLVREIASKSRMLSLSLKRLL